MDTIEPAWSIRRQPLLLPPCLSALQCFNVVPSSVSMDTDTVRSTSPGICLSKGQCELRVSTLFLYDCLCPTSAILVSVPFSLFDAQFLFFYFWGLISRMVQVSEWTTKHNGRMWPVSRKQGRLYFQHPGQHMSNTRFSLGCNYRQYSYYTVYILAAVRQQWRLRNTHLRSTSSTMALYYSL